MTDESTALSGHAHLWKVDAVLGVSAALMAFTVAQAALPTPPQHTRPVAYVVPPPRVAPAAEPAVLIAFAEPLPGHSIVSPFGLRRMPWEGHSRLHAGVDIASEAGRPILASADGVVTRVSQDAGYGRFVEVKHAEGLSTFYAHMGRSLPHIAPGVAVKAGTPLGLVGSTGSSTGAHLHFEIRDSQERPLNPTLFLDHKFATSDQLPLQAGLRMPRGIRVAMVGHIPSSRREQAQFRLAARQDARSAGEAGVNASATGRLDDIGLAVDKVAGRPHARISTVFSLPEAEPSRSDPPA